MTDEVKTGIEGSGFDYNDVVLIPDGTDAGAIGHVRGIHRDSKRIDVTIDKKGHKQHGYIITVQTADVKRLGPVGFKPSLPNPVTAPAA